MEKEKFAKLREREKQLAMMTQKQMGDEVLKNVEKNPKNPENPIVSITRFSKDDLKLIILCQEFGFDLVDESYD